MSSILTAREQEMICYIWQSCNTVPDVDLDKVASMGGYKTKASANTAYHKLKAKMMAFGNANTNDDADADADADAEDTPAPVVKKGRGKKAAPVKTEEPETDEDDEPETIVVKSKAKPKDKATKVAAVKAAPAKPAPKGRTTRASLRARKSLAKDESSADEDEVKKPKLELKTGPAKYPKNIHVKPTITDVPDDSAAGAEESAADTNVLKRAATEPASDDELAQPKRAKVDDEVDDAEIVAEVNAILDAAVEPAATKPVVVSTDPRIESFVVNDTDAVNASAADIDITMTGEDGSGASDVRSDVASAADSNDRDL